MPTILICVLDGAKHTFQRYDPIVPRPITKDLPVTSHNAALHHRTIASDGMDAGVLNGSLTCQVGGGGCILLCRLEDFTWKAEENNRS